MRRLLIEGLLKTPLTEARPGDDDAMLAELAERLQKSARRVLGHSLSIRQVDAGSCNACELEIHALSNVYYDLERFGLRFVASPRHADVLLVTGPVTKNMREALERTYNATPNPQRRGCGPGRSAHPRVPADTDGAAPGFGRAHGACGGRDVGGVS